MLIEEKGLLRAWTGRQDGSPLVLVVVVVVVAAGESSLLLRPSTHRRRGRPEIRASCSQSLRGDLPPAMALPGFHAPPLCMGLLRLRAWQGPGSLRCWWWCCCCPRRLLCHAMLPMLSTCAMSLPCRAMPDCAMPWHAMYASEPSFVRRRCVCALCHCSFLFLSTD